MKIPKQPAQEFQFADPLEGVALNQNISDREIINKILMSKNDDKNWASAIKIGDVWLSIPSRIIAIRDPIFAVNNTAEWNTFEELKPEVKKELGLPGPVSERPYEKFIGFSTIAENNTRMSESLNRLTNIVVENNAPADKVFILEFQCNAMSIQNNIRPLMAQFLVAPFLPVQNADLARIVNPHDQNPDSYLQLGKATLTEGGQFVWGPSVLALLLNLGEKDTSLDTGTSSTDLYFKQLKELNPNLTLNQQVRFETMEDVQAYYQEKAYWEVPFYIQLLDYSIQSISDKRNAFDLRFVVRVVEPYPAYGSLPLYHRKEVGVKRQLEMQRALMKARKGDNPMVDKITRMFRLNEADADSDIEISRLTELADYNPFGSVLELEFQKYLGISDITSRLLHASSLRMAVPNNKGTKDINEVNLLAGNSNNKNIVIRDTTQPDQAANTSFPLEVKANGRIFQITRDADKRINETIPGVVRGVTGLPLLEYVPNPNVAENVSIIAKQEREEAIAELLLRKDDITIIQYNLKNFIPAVDPAAGKIRNNTYEPERPYDERLYQYALFLNGQDADIIAFQELGTLPKGIEDILKILNTKELTDKRKYKSKYQMIFNPLLRTSDDIQASIQVGALSRIPVENTDNGVLPGQKIDVTKSSLIAFGYNIYNSAQTEVGLAELKTQLKTSRPILKLVLNRGNNSKVTIFICHFKSRLTSSDSFVGSEISRKFEAIALMEEIHKLPAEMPYMVVGDFNYGYFQEPSSTGTIARLGLKNNTIVRKNTDKTKAVYKFQTIESGAADYKSLDTTLDQPNTIKPIDPLFWNTLDIILCDDISLMLDISEGRVTLDIESKKTIQDYYLKVYGKTISADNIDQVTLDKLKRFIMYPAVPQLAKDGNAAGFIQDLRTRMGTFFSEEQAVAASGQGWSILDHILYSHHFFKESSNVKYNGFTGNIINNYNDKNQTLSLNSEGKYVIVPVTDTDPDRIKEWRRSVSGQPQPDGTFKVNDQYSDHFPVKSSFSWQPTPTALSSLAIDQQQKYRKQYIFVEAGKQATGREDTLWDVFETFPTILLSKEDVERVTRGLEQNLLRSTEGNQNIDSDKIILLTKDDTTAIVTGIYFSFTNRTYMFTGAVIKDDEIENVFLRVKKNDLIDIDKWIKNVLNGFDLSNSKRNLADTFIDAYRKADHNDISFITKSINISKALSGTFHSSSVDAVDTVGKSVLNRESLLGMFIPGNPLAVAQVLKEVPEFIQRVTDRVSKADDTVQSLNDIDRLNLTVDDLVGVNQGLVEYLNPEIYANYFLYSSNEFEGFPEPLPSELTLNISQSQPFRNYYLPLLREFADAPLQESFDWQYTFQIDTMEPLVKDFHMNLDLIPEDTRFVFVRKRTNRFTGNLLSKIDNAINVIAKFRDGTKDQKARYIGTLADKQLNGGSARIRGMVARQISINPNASYDDIRKRLLRSDPDITGSKNVLLAETLLFLAIKATQILLLLDDQEENQVAKIFEIGFEPTASIYQGLEETTVRYLENETRYYAYLGLKGNRLSQLNLSKERRKVQEYLDIERSYALKMASRSDSSSRTADGFRGAVEEDDSGSIRKKTIFGRYDAESLKGINELSVKSLALIMKQFRTAMLETIARLTKPDTEIIPFTRILD